MSDRFLCIHGHFYQPPRENPWLEFVEVQDSAYPYHDWNERITAECYAPNAAARLFDDEGRITQIVNNYARISFDMGPTLLAWMEQHAPGVYRAVLDADAESVERFGGHGSGMAQAYGHLIMALANERDRRTQVIWGIRDFEHRFGRAPEGMWLPETAVDLLTLDLLAEQGLAFTVLAPHQARRVRKIGGRSWSDVDGARIDPTMPYSVRLPSGRRIAVFFYDGPISRAVAFEGLLSSGERFADRLVSGYAEGRDHTQLVHIATDGETYGHHHRHGDMALAYALHHIEQNSLAKLTNYGEFLERFPPTHEADIIESTSWSCSHGVERWRADCGCRSGEGWSQSWRAPLREALDWLRDELNPRYENLGASLLTDPWGARDDYVAVLLDRSAANVDGFLDRYATHPLSESERIAALKLLELQRHAMQMFTSCGWFFDEVSGIETTQVLQYAGRALQLADELFERDLEPEFLERLAKAPSNLPELGDGRQVFERLVRPARVDFTTLAAHYGVSSLFEDYDEDANVYCYEVHAEDYQILDAGRTRLATGRVRLTSSLTREWGRVVFAVLHLGDHNINAGVARYVGDDDYWAMVNDLNEAFSGADVPDVVRRIDRHFGGTPYSLRTLFKDQQRRVLLLILDNTIAEAQETYRRLYEHHAPLMRFLADIQVPLPKPFRTTAEQVLDAHLRLAFGEEHVDIDSVQSVFRETAQWGLDLDVEGLAFTLRTTLETVAARLRDDPEDALLVERLGRLVTLAQSLPWTVDLSQVQSSFYAALRQSFARVAARADGDDEVAREWITDITDLAGKLHVALPG